MRHCNKDCTILEFVVDDVCPILLFKKTRIESSWYFEKDGVKYHPLCESGSYRSHTRKRKGNYIVL